MKSNRPMSCSLALLVCAAVWYAAPPAPAANAAAGPNVILFLVDDMGWMDSTPYGSTYYDAPNMERFAKRAMRFTQAYATPLCSPTRASILTGKYSARHGITTASGHLPPQPAGFKFLADEGAPGQRMLMPVSRNYLGPSEYTLAEALRDAGWKTAHIGKWHLGLTEPHWPERQGFEVAIHGKPDPGPASYFSPYGFRAGQTFKDGPPGEYITDRFTDEACKFIEDNRDKPFFLNLWHHGVHGPWGHKEELTRSYADRKDPRGKQGNPIMASMLKSVDDSLGRVMDKLDELKLADNTIVIFYSDNGGNVHSNTPDDAKRTQRGGKLAAERLNDWRKWAGDQPPTNNHPLRNGKGTLYEGGVRVPLMVAWPGAVRPGTTSDAVVAAVDMYPTILDALKLKPNPQQKMDGISFVQALNQSGPLNREAVFNYFPHGGAKAGVTVRAGDWKLIRWFDPGQQAQQHELYNLREDLGESNNLAAGQPAKVKELDAMIDRFLKDTGALAPKPNPKYDATAARELTPKQVQRRAARRAGQAAND
jgi:arylsulfatase A-like enzyme